MREGRRSIAKESRQKAKGVELIRKRKMTRGEDLNLGKITKKIINIKVLLRREGWTKTRSLPGQNGKGMGEGRWGEVEFPKISTTEEGGDKEAQGYLKTF